MLRHDKASTNTVEAGKRILQNKLCPEWIKILKRCRDGECEPAAVLHIAQFSAE